MLTLLNPIREGSSIVWKPKMHHPFGGQVFICEQMIRFILKISKDAINRIKKKYSDQPLFLFWPPNENLGGNNKKIDHWRPKVINFLNGFPKYQRFVCVHET